MTSKKDIRLALNFNGAFTQRLVDEIIWIIRVEFGPIVSEAGLTLRIIPAAHSIGDLNIEFDSRSRPRAPGPMCGFILGEDGLGLIDVWSHKQLRVCKTTNGGRRAYRRVLNYNSALGRAVANCAIHELGHFVAGLEHVADRHNYMTTSDPPIQTRVSMRQTYAKQQFFTVGQRQQLVLHLATRNWVDPVSVNGSSL